VPHDDYNYEHVDVGGDISVGPVGSVVDASAAPGHVAPITGDDAELAAGEIVEEIEVVEADEPVYGEGAVDGAPAVPARESGSSVDEAVADDSEETAAFGHS
jgi:hypothetical protein